MPAKTQKQAKFMRAVYHGFVPDKVPAPPKAVAKEFMSLPKAPVKKK